MEPARCPTLHLEASEQQGVGVPHSVSLITTIAAALGLALVLGFAAARLRLPALVGYLVAGVLIGPSTPGFVADLDIAGQLAEIGVMLLMFGVGLHFSLDDLLAVRKIAVPGAIVQIAVATALGAGTALVWGWPAGEAVVFGLALSVASTVVLLRALEAGEGRAEDIDLLTQLTKNLWIGKTFCAHAPGPWSHCKARSNISVMSLKQGSIPNSLRPARLSKHKELDRWQPFMSMANKSKSMAQTTYSKRVCRSA